MVNNLIGLAVLLPGTNYRVNSIYRPNLVKPTVRQALLQGGLGKKNPEVPLADVVEPGMTVLVKPNWVLHYNQSGLGMECLVTHPEFILAAIEEVANAKPGRIIIGDAPLQGCKWEQLVTADLIRSMEKAASGVLLEIVDFRRKTLDQDRIVGSVRDDIRSESQYVLFDLGSDSMLEPISVPEGRFRVTMYDPEKLAYTHRPGKHQYLVCREAIEADVILNLPKLKTHRKSGITASLKNLVGINGNKDYLPHHRVGGPLSGGDCYPNDSPWKQTVELYFDLANKKIGSPAGEAWRARASQLLDLYGRFDNPEIEGGWYGNDTIWRTVIDLNRILLYGKLDGTLSETVQRAVLSLTDALVIGEGEGPLASKPRILGAVTFATSSVNADLVNAVLLRLDPMRIPLIKEALSQFRWPLRLETGLPVVQIGDREISLSEAARKFSISVDLPRGWVGSCELDVNKQILLDKQPIPNSIATSAKKPLPKSLRQLSRPKNGSQLYTLFLEANDLNPKVDIWEPLSYVLDWREATFSSPDLKVERCNINNIDQFTKSLSEIQKYDLIIVSHTAAGDDLTGLSKTCEQFLKRRGKLVVFIGNEYDLMEEKIDFIKATQAEFICSQLPGETSGWLYSDCKNSRLLSLPHALNPDKYKCEPSIARKIDIGFVGNIYFPWIGDLDRTRVINYFQQYGRELGLVCDIRTERMPRAQWAQFLNSSKGIIGAEAGTYFLNGRGRLLALAKSYYEEHPKASFEEIYERFFIGQVSPVSGKAISSRHFEPIGTKTCQLLVEGYYNGILLPDHHYICIKKDFSNMGDVLRRFKDDGYRQAIVDRTYEFILSAHTYKHRVQTLVKAVSA